MSPIIHRINSLHKELLSLLPMKEEYRQKLDKKFRMEFNYNSNHIEGNTLTYQETELLLIFDQSKGNHEMRELEEMKAHDVAYGLVEEWATDKEHKITEADIRSLNEIILVKSFWKDAITPGGQHTRRQIKVGTYKEHPNSVQLANGQMFHYASPAETPIKMGELIQWYREEEEKKELSPVALAALFHYKFVLIHPFDDGNGRISRLLMNYILLKNDLPPVIIKSDDKKNYLRSLNEADTGNLDAFVEYVAEQELWSLDIAIKAAKGESIDEPGDLDKEIFVWKKKLKNVNAEAKPKSGDMIVEIYVKGLKYLLDSYHEKMYKSFHDLFVEWDEKGFVNGAHYSNKDISLIEEKMRELSESFTKGVNSNEIHTLSLIINMKGFKRDGINAFSINSSLNVTFESFKYIISGHYGFQKEKLYGEWITTEEAVEIVDNIVKNVFENIKNNMKSIRR